MRATTRRESKRRDGGDGYFLLKGASVHFNNRPVERFAVQGGTESRFGKSEKGKSATFVRAL